MASGVPSLPAGYPDPDLGFEARNCAIAFIIISVFIVILKNVSRLVTKVRSGWDDWLLIPALGALVAQAAVIIFMTLHTGLGRHTMILAQESPEMLTLYGKMELVQISLYALAVVSAKLIILSIYLRFFTQKRYRIACWVLVAINIGYFCVAILITMLECRPIEANWDPTLPGAQCIDLDAWWTYSTIPTVLHDLFMIALPVPVVWNLKLSLKDKIGLILTFTAALIGTAGSCARIVLFATIDNFEDPTWDGVPLAIACLIETGSYLFVSCLPGIRPLWRYLRRQGQFSKRAQVGYASNARVPLRGQSTTSDGLSSQEHRYEQFSDSHTSGGQSGSLRPAESYESALNSGEYTRATNEDAKIFVMREYGTERASH